MSQENNSLPVYLQMYIEEENKKYLKQNNINKKSIYDDSYLDYLEYKKELSKGYSYYYLHKFQHLIIIKIYIIIIYINFK